MTIDRNVYELARTYLAPLGETYEGTVMQLAERIQDCIDDFEADLKEHDGLQG